MARKKAAGRRESGTGSIYRDGSGYRAAVLIGHDPKTGRPFYKRIRTATHAEAVDALKRMQREADAGRVAIGKSPTLAEYLPKWLASLDGSRAPKTVEQYRWLVERHILPTMGGKQMDRVTRQDVRKLLEAKSRQTVENGGPDKRTLSANTLRLIRAVLQSAYNDALGADIVARNPAEKVALPSGATQPEGKGKGFLDPAEADRLYQACADCDLGDLFAFMLQTGTRIGEATGLRWQDVDLGESPRVVIAGQLSRLDRRLQYVPRTKGKRSRALPLPGSLAERLKALKGSQTLSGVSDPDGIVFLNADGRRIDPKHANNRLKALCLRAGVPPVSAHKLRHTVGTLLRSQGVPDYHVQQLLGHSQLALTVNLYGAHSTQEMLRPAADLLSFTDRKD